MTVCVFVYGTLLPGDVRWHHLAPFVDGDGTPDSVTGRLFDTGQGYPAAIFDARAEPGGTIHGHTFTLSAHTSDTCLDVLDEVEGVVGGLYTRVSVTTRRGDTAWAYEYGHGLDLVEIESGDWPTHLARLRSG